MSHWVGIGLLSVFVVAMFLAFRWLAWYGSDSRQRNSAPAWNLWSWFAPAPDSTVSAYDRQIREHARLNDQHAEAAMATREQREITTETRETIAYTEQP